MPSSAGRLYPLGSTPRIVPSRPCSMSPSTTTPRHRTNSRNGTSAAAAMLAIDVSRRRQRAHAEYHGAGQRGPGRRETQHRRDGESDQRQAQHHQHEHRHRCRIGDRLRRGFDGKVPREKPTQQDEFDGHRRQPRRGHHRGEMEKREASGAERQQVGEIGNRQQQRRCVGQMRGGVCMRPRRNLQCAGCREHHRGQQHDCRVEAQYGGRRGADDENLHQQLSRAAVARPRHRGACGAEQALVVA